MTGLTTGAAISAGSARDLGDVMVAMTDAFDPRFGEAWTEAQCGGILGMPGSHLLVARDGDRPTGFAMLRTIADETELLLIAVRAGDQRRGIGRALLARVIDLARSQGARALHLEVRDGNGAAWLYREAGFVQVGRRRQYYRGRDGESFDALTFRLRLG
ncbi:GNAT family N-acetyltransferase [Sphingomonas changnyeongensis]|nr:GNAT family N-acetyltransferase [Sphingomonas changnyeongensis]